MNKNKLKDKLNRFSSHISSGSSGKAQPQLPSRYTKLAKHTSGELKYADAGTYCLVTTTYPWTHDHGSFTLSDIRYPSQPLSAFIPEEHPEQLPLENLLFIDTETTGLGGSGAVAFLIGVGSITNDGFEIRQYLLPDFSDEAAMLEDVLSELSEEYSLVSYNGAAFDLPLIRDRFIINRVGRELPFNHHVDLLHSVRRLYKRRLGDCRLVNIEAELFNFTRTDDIPGYLVPSIYFEWLGDESLEFMNGVLEHNRLDILSLYVLLQQIGLFYTTCGETSEEVDDLHSLARFMNRQQQPDKSIQLFGKMTEVSDDLADDMLYFHALNYKKSSQWGKAVSLFEKIANQNSREAYWANIELAKYYEHKNCNFDLALEHTSQARDICPYGKGHFEALEKRRLRLLRKAGK